MQKLRPTAQSPLVNLPPGQSNLAASREIVAWLRDPLQFFQERHDRYGPIWRTRLLNKPTVVMLGPDANRFVLGTHLQLFSSRDGWGDSLYNLIGEGLSLQDGARHHERRIQLQPAFHQRAVGKYFAAMERLTHAHLEGWFQQGDLALFDGFKSLTFAIICEVLLGVSEGPLYRALEHHFEPFNAGLFSPVMLDVPWLPFGRAIRARAALAVTLRAIIAERRGGPAGDDALGMLLQATDGADAPLSDTEIVSQLLLLLWAGHDTVTSLLTWTIHEIQRQPALLAALRAEQAAVLGNTAFALEHLRQLPLLDRVLREAERRHPPASGGFRGVRETFEWGGYTVPKGWLVMYSIAWTHHQPDLFADPLRFDPARFAAPRNEGRHAYSVIGFGGGPRICIGLALAMMEMRVILSVLLRRAEITVLPSQDFTAIATPTKRPKDKLKVHIARHQPSPRPAAPQLLHTVDAGAP